MFFTKNKSKNNNNFLLLQEQVEKLQKENIALQEQLLKFVDKHTYDENNELMRMKQWHMQFFYDKKLSELGLYNVEKNHEGNKKRLEELRECHLGKRCFIIGNGPSLRAADLDKLKTEITFGVNKITEIFNQTDWRPTYYFTSDPLYFEKQAERLELLKDITTVLLDSEILNTMDLSAMKNVIYYFHIRRYSIIPDFSTYPNLFVYEGGSVLYHAIQFALYMGIKEIYLLGTDNNFKKVALENGRMIWDICSKEPSHFYSVSEEEVQLMHSFETWMDLNNLKASGIFDPDDMWQAVKYHCDIHNVLVFNATRGGELELFPRKDFNSVM